MLKITIPGGEFWDSSKNEFVYTKDVTVRMEHSLISLTKWEEKYKKPFLSEKEKTIQETLYYFKCMCIDPVPDDTFDTIPQNIYDKIMAYISDPVTATTINIKNVQQMGRKGKRGSSPKKEVMTSELIYYYMSAFNIPYTCEKWRLNHLLTLIEISSIKTAEMNGGGKMNKGAAAKYNADLNRLNRQLLGTKG